MAKARRNRFTFTLLNADDIDDKSIKSDLEEAFGDGATITIVGREYEDPSDPEECIVECTVESEFGFDRDEIADAVLALDYCDNPQASGPGYNTMSADSFNITDKEKKEVRSSEDEE